MEQELTEVKTDVAEIKKDLYKTGIKLEKAIEAKLLKAVENEWEEKVEVKVDGTKRK